jgi:hypothetical protein
VRQATSEDFRREVGSTLATEWTLRNDPAVRHGHDRCRYVFSAPLAPHRKIADPCSEQLPHRNSIGEQMANICTIARSTWGPLQYTPGTTRDKSLSKAPLVLGLTASCCEGNLLSSHDCHFGKPRWYSTGRNWCTVQCSGGPGRHGSKGSEHRTLWFLH